MGLVLGWLQLGPVHHRFGRMSLALQPNEVAQHLCMILHSLLYSVHGGALTHLFATRAIKLAPRQGNCTEDFQHVVRPVNCACEAGVKVS